MVHGGEEEWEQAQAQREEEEEEERREGDWFSFHYNRDQFLHCTLLSFLYPHISPLGHEKNYSFFFSPYMHHYITYTYICIYIHDTLFCAHNLGDEGSDGTHSTIWISVVWINTIIIGVGVVKHIYLEISLFGVS